MLLVVFLAALLGVSQAAPASGTCMCVHGSHVNCHTSGTLSSSSVTQVSTGECFTFNGGVHTDGGYHFYELQDVHGHHRVWVASNYLRTSTSSHCHGGGSTGGGGTHTFATGVVPQQCLDCICQVESGCKPIGCHFDVNSDSCGYFQIKNDYWLDCGSPGTSWKACANDLHCSSQCVQAYMLRYASHYGCSPTCQDYAREHNGGPQGCKHSSTIGYWHKVQAKGCH